MSRGVADNRDPDDANLPSQSGPITSQGRANGISVPPPPSTDMLAQNPQSSAPNGAPSSPNGIQQPNEPRERSPGPRLEEMATTSESDMEFPDVEDMSRFIRLSGDFGFGHGRSHDSNEVFDPDLRRVKVYELIGSRWTDRGTAFCSGEYDNETEEARLIARAEGTHEVILCCMIRTADIYQRQQDTLIVWTELDGTDFALSFQDVEGCSEVWEFITEVQKHLNCRGMTEIYDFEVYPSLRDSDDSIILSPVISNFDHVPTTAAQIVQSGHLPPPSPDAGFITEIEKAMRNMARSPKSREQICNYIQENRYIHQLLEVFEAAEKAENLDALHALCSCMQTILLLNEHTMYEHILSDELWMGVVGMLEYDPEFPKFKANYREFLLQRSHFVQPITIRDEAIQRKIHATYRLQYLKDVILGRALDDSTFNVLNSCIIFNQMDIINHIMRDEPFLAELVFLFIKPTGTKGKEREKDSDMEIDKPSEATTVNGVVASSAGPSSSPQASHSDESTDVERKKEVILLLQQLCIMGKNVQLPTRINLFRTLVERGVLYAVQWALCRTEKHIIFSAGEILSVLLDHHALSIRNHILTQGVALKQPTGNFETLMNQENSEIPDVTGGSPPPFKETLSQVLCRMMANSQDLALQTQFADALRLLVDVPAMEPQRPPEVQNGVVGLPMQNTYLNRPLRDDHAIERFLDNFYKTCIETLMRPLTHDVPDHHELKDEPYSPSRERGNLYLYLCDLLCSFAIQHSFRIYFFILSSNVFSRIASLLSVKDKHLCLAALRFFRICLKMNNRNLFIHMHKHDCFTPICKLTIREARRENLLSCTCQEFFEFMRRENLREPINFVMEKHESDVRELAKSALGSATFQGFVARWEINKEPLPPEVVPEKRQHIMIPRIPGQRVMESEEDDSYFNSDDNEEDNIVPVPRVDSSLFGLFRRKRQRISTPGPHAQMNKGQRLMSVPSQNRPVSPLSSLLEYDDDEEMPPLSEQIRSEKEPPAPRPPILPPRQIQILPYEPNANDSEPSDPEDELLESLVSKDVDEKPPPPDVQKGPPATTQAQVPEKRRRGEEEEDAFERLAPKNRRLSNASDEASQVAAAKVRAAAAAETTRKAGEEGGPKKLKLKFSAASKSSPLSETRTSVAAKKTEVKDGTGNG
ncbi:DUF625-domain-containing protein [Fomitiporia mediterranea MF3/22]|uniref:DUF625-domain-containing protein n=1 Tax=Fomitiporia mediterranea (strain MF3/22) TaxID=694068 RepID=UPI0004408297|nr:DUF625-domain-containing protein [Fomitiporia mediterranea MF3/22]EJD01533.1 DUF625-domain-containing protein [Fomitiporia mediterranea MF3/22]